MNMQIVIVGLLSAFFVFASSIKILGWQKMIFNTQLVMFIKYGMNRQFMVLTGLAELFGSITIWLQSSWIGTVGALVLLGTSTGAVLCHLIFDTWKEGVPAMITGTLAAFIVWTNRAPLLDFLGMPGLI